MKYYLLTFLDSCFIEKTKNNKDNHSAWIIHVKEIEKENDDLKLPNEELTARCNVVVSMPEIMNAKSDNNEDVVVMEGKKNIFQKIKDFLYKV